MENKVHQLFKPSIFKLKSCKKSYGKKVILDSVDLEISQGEFHALVGENGSGKSTLLKLISGHELLNKGDILFQDHSVFDINNPNAGEFIFISELSEIISRQNLENFVQLFQKGNPKWNQPKFEKLVKARRFDLSRNFQELSRGQKMQFNLMMALSSQPKALLIDEITAVLDIEARHFFLSELKEFTDNGGTLIITSNIITELEDFATSMSIIKDQGIKFSGSKNDFRKHFCKFTNPSPEEFTLMDEPKKLFFQKEKEVFISKSNNEISSIESLTLQEIVLYFYSDYHKDYYDQAA